MMHKLNRGWSSAVYDSDSTSSPHHATKNAIATIPMFEVCLRSESCEYSYEYATQREHSNSSLHLQPDSNGTSSPSPEQKVQDPIVNFTPQIVPCSENYNCTSESDEPYPGATFGENQPNVTWLQTELASRKLQLRRLTSETEAPIVEQLQYDGDEMNQAQDHGHIQLRYYKRDKSVKRKVATLVQTFQISGSTESPTHCNSTSSSPTSRNTRKPSSIESYSSFNAAKQGNANQRLSRGRLTELRGNEQSPEDSRSVTMKEHSPPVSSTHQPVTTSSTTLGLPSTSSPTSFEKLPGDTSSLPASPCTQKLRALESGLPDDDYNAPTSLVSSEAAFGMDSGRLSDLHISRKRSSESISLYDRAVQTNETTDEQYSDAPFIHNDALNSLHSQQSQTRCSAPLDATARSSGFTPLRIFVGTWNTQYGDFPLSSLLARTPECPPNISSSLSATGHNIKSHGTYVGSNDRNTEYNRDCIRRQILSHPPHRNESKRLKPILQPRRRNSIERTSINPFSKKFSSKPDEPRPEQHVNEFYSRRRTTALSKNISILQPPDNYEPFGDWIPAGYDVYIIALQESVSDQLLDPIVTYLNRVSYRLFEKITFTEDKISGLGDGAYLAMKSTTIGCIVAQDVLGKCVTVGSSKAVSLSSLNGSKGAVSIILTIYNQIVCFVSCHLPAGAPDVRLKARKTIQRRLTEAYCGFSDVGPTDVFHHIVWAGDFNLRIQELTAEAMLAFLTQGSLSKALLFDEFSYTSHNCDFVTDGYEEAFIEFYPTYKKHVGRSPVNLKDPLWFHKEYNLYFKAQWYKGGKIKERVPSWTDRIFKWSQPSLRNCLVFLPNTYRAASPSFQTVLLASDHSAVGCGFALFPLTLKYSLPPVFLYNAKDKDQRSEKRAR